MNNFKNEFEFPMATVILFDNEDVITASVVEGDVEGERDSDRDSSIRSFTAYNG